MQAQQRKVDSLTELLIEEKKRQGAIKPEDVSASAFQTQNQLETRLTEEKARYNTASATYESLKKQLDILSGSVSNTAGATDEVLKLQTQKRELISKLNQGGNDADIRAQIDQINRRIAANTTTPTNIRRKEKIDDLNLQLAEQQGIINASSTTINQLESQIRNVSGKTNLGAGSEIKLSTLWSSLDMENRQLVQIKDKFFQAQGMLKESLTSNFKQTIVGQPSSFPDPDKRYYNMGVAGTSAFMFTSFLFLLAALLNNRIKTPSFFRRLTAMPLLAVVNKINNRKGMPDVNELLSTGSSMNKSYDQFRESMRKLRFGIESSGKKKILFTSLKPDTGKTTLIISIANTLKLSRKRVLLIDTNFSNNSISQRYGVTTYIEDSAKMSMHPELLRNLISKTDDPHIDVLGCRGGMYTPSEILPKENILGNLENLFPEYDLFILEGPALANHTDSHELIRYVDGVIAVFSADENITQADNVLINSLEGLGDKGMGAILNDVDLEDVDA
jgi:Mrp family chromosome partitioning ATPase